MSVDFERMAAHLPADQRKQLSRQYRHGAKNETAAFLSCFFLGIFGVHHFYLGEWARGFAHLIIPVVAALAVVAGVLGNLPSLPITIVVVVLLVIGLIWEIMDLFQVDKKVRERNLRLAESLIGASALADNTALTGAGAKLDSAMTGAAVGAGVATGASGAITAEDVSAAQTMAGAHHGGIMEEYDSSTTTYISDDPNATSPGAPRNWSESGPYQPMAASSTGTADPSAGDTLDMPAPEYVTHTHTETDNSVTDSYEFDRSPDATQPMPIPTASEAEAKTWPDYPPLAETATPAVAAEPLAEPVDTGVPLAGLAAGAAALGAGALLMGAHHAGETNVAGVDATGADATDLHADVTQAEPIADVEGASASPQYVTLSEGQPAPAGFAPMMVDASTTAHDATDAHPHVHHGGQVADVEVNPAHPVYVDLPGETYVPPVVPTEAPGAGGAALAGLAAAGAVGAGAAYLGSHAHDAEQAAPDATPEAAPTSGPLMKRIRMKRQIVVDGQVVREEIVEKLVPVDADTTSLVAEMDTQLGHASKEEIAHMANLDPDTSLDVRHRMDVPHHQSEEPPAE